MLLLLKNKKIRNLPKILFSDPKCNLESEIISEYQQSLKLTKEILQKFFELHLVCYGQYYKQMVI